MNSLLVSMSMFFTLFWHNGGHSMTTSSLIVEHVYVIKVIIMQMSIMLPAFVLSCVVKYSGTMGRSCELRVGRALSF